MISRIRYLALLTLVGCAAGPRMEASTQSVGRIDSLPEQVYAMPTEDTAPRVITEYVPVPMPGQLMPAPTTTLGMIKDDGGFATKEEAVQYANSAATVSPTEADFFNAMMQYHFMPGAMYVIYAAPMKLTDIMLEPGEQIISQAAGDTLRWQLAQTRSGEGASARAHILVKPNKAGIENTVVVTTNRRVYHLVLKSTDTDTYMVSVSWHYGRDMLSMQSQENNDFSMPPMTASVEPSLPELDFNFEFGMLEGSGQPNWYPERVFTNGRQTYIGFSGKFDHADLPVLYVTNDAGQYSTMVNWRLQGRYMVVDKVIQQARLQSGVEKTGRTIVQIQHK